MLEWHYIRVLLSKLCIDKKEAVLAKCLLSILHVALKVVHENYMNDFTLRVDSGNSSLAPRLIVL